MADIPGNSSTGSTISVGGSLTDSLEVMGDHDWIRIQLTAGQSISVLIDGLTLEDPYLRIRNASGEVIFENDDITPGEMRDSLLAFTATYTGTYYIDVGAWVPDPGEEPPGYTGTGTYTVSASPYTPPPLGTVQQLADYLVSGHWEERHFNVSPGGSITVNLSELTSAGRTLATAALATWSSITGINFVQVTQGGQITFDDNEEGAFSTSVVSNGIILSSHVNVSVDWIAGDGTALNTYSFQTYIHEIGHALGLGHQGGYNGEARYPYDAEYQNDGWPLSVMSYFDQKDNTYFAGQGFDFNYVTTPMMADILAMSMLYGLSTTTRAGNDSYGGSVAGGAFCVFDSGGIDTLSGHGHSGNQLINLNPGTFSNIYGDVGNISIALGVIIENAIGGSGADTIIGNDAANFLEGRDGNDTLTGAAGDDTLDGGAGSDALDGGAGNDRIIWDATDNLAQVLGGAGTDTLVINGVAAPTSFNLATHGFERAEVMQFDGAGNPWSTILSTYNAGWQLTDQDVRFDTGSRTQTSIDVVNSQNWSQRWVNYDAQGRFTSEDRRFDDGSRSWAEADAANSQNWSQRWVNYDAQGRFVSEDRHFDNGTRTWSEADAANTQNWSQRWVNYDALGRFTGEDRRFDDGSRTWAEADAANSQNWSRRWVNYDALGRFTSEDCRFDDGTRTWSVADANNGQAWSREWYHYDAQGDLYAKVTAWDDGSTTYNLF